MTPSQHDTTPRPDAARDDAPNGALALAALAIVCILAGGGYWLVRNGAGRGASESVGASPTPASDQAVVATPRPVATRAVAARDVLATDVPRHDDPIAPTVAVEPDASAALDLTSTPESPAAAERTLGPIAPSGLDRSGTRTVPPPGVGGAAREGGARAPARSEGTLIAVPSTPTPAGEAGIVEGLRNGRLRLASDADLRQWIARSGGAASLDGLTSFAGGRAYVITGDFTIPDGLTGAHAVLFVLPPGVPYPRGNPGHCAILDLASGACSGPTCRMLRD